MKRIILTVSTILTTLTALSQLQVSRSENPEIIKIYRNQANSIALTARVSTIDTSYTVAYRNKAYSHIIDYKAFNFDNKESVYQLIDLVSENTSNEDIKTSMYLISKIENTSMVSVNSYDYFYTDKLEMQEMKVALNNFK